MANEKVFIIVTAHNTIESVWTTYELARAAIVYHASESNQVPTYYRIIDRTLNQTKMSIKY